MKKYNLKTKLCLFAILILPIINIYANDMTNDAFIPPKVNEKPWYEQAPDHFNNMQILKAAYWSSFGVSGSISVFALIGQTLQANDISTKLLSIHKKVKNEYNTDLTELYQFANAYPALMFGAHSLISGTAFIPISGGLVFGTLQYALGIFFSAAKSISPIDIPYFNNFPGTRSDSIYKDFVEINDSMFDPSSFYAVGTVSIIFGIAEVILHFYYEREVRRAKYPQFQRIVTMIPGGFSIGLPL